MKDYALTLLLVCFLIFVGCSTLDSKASILRVANGVEFSSNTPADISMIENGIEYKYNTQKVSFFTRVFTAITQAVVGGRK